MSEKLREALEALWREAITAASSTALSPAQRQRIHETCDAARAALAAEEESARPLEEYHEDIGDVLWWRFPVDEPPYVGTPDDSSWPGYHTHWTRIKAPPSPTDKTP